MTCSGSHGPSGLRIENRAAHTFYIVFTGTLDLVQQWCIFNTQSTVFKESISLWPQSTHIRNESPGNDHGHSTRLRHTKILLILLRKHFFWNCWWEVVWAAFLETTAVVDVKGDLEEERPHECRLSDAGSNLQAWGHRTCGRLSSVIWGSSKIHLWAP